MHRDFAEDYSNSDYSLAALMRWVALSGTLLGAVVIINMNPAMSAHWVTLVGTPGNPGSDFVELETDASLSPLRHRVVRLRINRAVEAKSVTGIAYRSFDGTARVDCVRRQARYTKGTYYKEPSFKGEPIAKESFTQPDQPFVALRGFDDAYSRLVVELGCGLAPE